MWESAAEDAEAIRFGTRVERWTTSHCLSIHTKSKKIKTLLGLFYHRLLMGCVTYKSLSTLIRTFGTYCKIYLHRIGHLIHIVVEISLTKTM